jgi:hypothetical protein
MTDERIKAAKNMAAVKAFEAYVTALKDAVGEENLAEALGNSGHIHKGILFVGDKTVAVSCEWNFSTEKSAVGQMLQERSKGSTPPS